MSIYAQSVPVFDRGLTNLENWIDEAHAHAESVGFDPAVLLVARLAPDQFDLTRQIQTTCDLAKLTSGRFAEVDPPKHEDGPATFEQLRQRIAEVRTFIGGLDRATIDASESRVLRPSFLQGAGMTVPNYLHQFALPNYYFHLTTSYAILRHNGVKIGKRAFLGEIDLIPPQ